MATRFQQLGAYISELQNVDYEKLRRFHEVGGRWVAPLISQVGYPYDHDPACVRNRAFLLEFQEWCRQLGIACGGWFMCWALNEAAADAAEIERYVKGYNLMPVILNCEIAYKEHPMEFPMLLMEVRKRILTRSLFASVIDLNDSMIWNGGSLGHVACCRQLNVRASPQWYSGPRYQGSPWFDPFQNMRWLAAHRTQGNFHCAVRKDQMAMPMSWVKGTLEVTGLEGSSLARSIESLYAAKNSHWYDYGYSLYTLDSMPPEDFELVHQTRGRLFLV